MKLVPKYSYEYNVVLNETYNASEQIKNFASTLSDKDRFLPHLDLIEKNSELIEEKLGFKLKDAIEFYVVRCEKFKSFSEPITIEYSILPEEMLLFLLKEIIKTSVLVRFTTEEIREQYINSFVEHIAIAGDFGKLELVKFGKNLHDESKKNYPSYEFKDIDFSNKTLKEYTEELFKAYDQ
ncbi:MAG: hypothetical protein PF569_06310 [Candidatus Woesearchaeota archaeon]|jgi:hypothetical protein|nr:hypothetical protein [Candidatus Woesearchaeota archaeon]